MKGLMVNFVILVVILGFTKYFTADEITLPMILITLAWAALGAILATFLFRKLGV